MSAYECLKIACHIHLSEKSTSPCCLALEDLHRALNQDLETILVIDGSPDASGRLIVARQGSFPSGVLSRGRNFGAFCATRTGMEHARGRYLDAMAADLREPPELILPFSRILSFAAGVVLRQRVDRSDPPLTKMLSNLFWPTYRGFVVSATPKSGIDIFGCNRLAADAVLAIEEADSSLVAQPLRVGFCRRSVPYVRRQSLRGKDSWNMVRRFRQMMDSILSFSDLPILALLWCGAIGCGISAVVAILTLISRFAGLIQEPDYATSVILPSFFGPLNLAIQAILGCCIWRALENTKPRPLRTISRVVDRQGQSAHAN